jgi:predicted nucleic acid-binding protein
MGVIQAVGKGPVALDSSVFIYFIEEHPDFIELLHPLFLAIEQGQLQAYTSELTLLEILVVPYRLGRGDLAEQYETLLSGSRGFGLVPVNRPILLDAARIRARHNLKTPDAIQVISAVAAHCSCLLTNNRDFGRIEVPRILQLSDFI